MIFSCAKKILGLLYFHQFAFEKEKMVTLGITMISPLSLKSPNGNSAVQLGVASDHYKRQINELNAG